MATHRRMRSRAAALVLFAATIVAFGHSLFAAERSFAWKVTGRSTSIYVVGSVHLLSKDFYPLNPALDAAYKDSDLLVEEVDLGEMLEPEAQMRILSKSLLPSGQTLDKVLSPSTYEMLKVKVAQIGMPIEPIKQFKPWSLSITLMGMSWGQVGFDPGLGLDKHFYDRAKADGRLVQGLETTEFQISRFDEMSMADQDELLAQTIKELDTANDSVLALANAWRSGDLNEVDRLALKELRDEAKLYQRLIVDRNRNWMPKLEALFNRPGQALVVVGAAHLAGADGLLEMFKAKGYTIEQL
ncbi:MAG TPA: TraB/GumN family protein [Vicinamibacterales bacterium]|nr:TraB/GumN family protein [Vicinamibacterales bacterium]